MPILENLPDPRSQLILDFVTQLQAERRRREEERAESRARTEKRKNTGIAVGAGLLGGALLAPAAVASSAATGAAVTASGASAGGALLGSTLLGGTVGSRIGQSLANDDLGGAISSGLQGAATIANLPQLRAQGITPLQIASVGMEGLPRLLQSAEISSRQTENLIRQNALVSQRNNKDFLNLSPGDQSEVAEAENRLRNIGFERKRGLVSDEEAEQMSQPFVDSINAVFEAAAQANRERPTLQQRFDNNDGFATSPESGVGFFEQPDGAIKQYKLNPQVSAVERAEQKKLRIDDLVDEFTDVEIARQQMKILENNSNLSFFSRLSAQEANQQAKARVKASAAMATIIKNRATQQAEREIEELMPQSRLPGVKPTAKEAEQQQAAAEQQQQQQQAQQQQVQQQQRLQQAGIKLQTDVKRLQSLITDNKLDESPSKWSRANLDDAVEPAQGILDAILFLFANNALSDDEKRVVESQLKFVKQILEADRARPQKLRLGQ